MSREREYMSELKDFIKLIEEIESLLDSYDPGELTPDKIIGEIFKERAKQRPILEKAVQLASEGLEKYPFNAVLLRMRATARCWIVTPEGEFPELEMAEQDLQTILEFDPNNLKTGFELLDMLFTFSGMEDKDVAEVAQKFAAMAEELLLHNLALQIKALGYANEHSNAEEVYNRWIKLFPDSEVLKSAKADSDSMKPDQ
jgi:tetratricopeptide (TPR) repeat protein